MRIQGWVTSGLVVLLVLVFALPWGRGPGTVSATPTGRSASQDGGSCPLTTAQQVKSNKAWLTMMPVFRHPRCANCHGSMPKPLPERVQVGGKWQGGATIRHAGVVDMDSTDGNNVCEECHHPEWRRALNAPNWADKSDMDLCRGMHIVFEKNAPGFLDHILRDGGGPPFIDLAFAGRRGLNDGGVTIYETETGRTFAPAPPPGTHALLVQQARAWVAAQGGQFVGDKDCGCEKPETGEVYLLEIQRVDARGFPGIVVTDSASMKIRIEDTTVTVFAITNFPAIGIPQSLVFPQVTVRWIPDPVGLVNIVSATGSIALDFPTPNTRGLKIDFTHNGTHDPLFERIFPKNVRIRDGGAAIEGNPGSVQFDLVPGQKVYTTGRANLLVAKLTLLVAPKANPKPPGGA
jgi:hypothetical protein